MAAMLAERGAQVARSFCCRACLPKMDRYSFAFRLAVVSPVLGRSLASLERQRNVLAGEGHLCVACDVSHSASLGQACKIIDEAGVASILVHAAGITDNKLLVRQSPDFVQTLLATNLTSAVLLTQSVARAALRARLPSTDIVLLGSLVASQGSAGQAVYAASKAGLEGFARSAARELGARGVRINVLAPGFIATAMTDALPAERREQIARDVPLGAMGTVADVAAAVEFLLRSRYVTGTVLRLDGGLGA